MVPLSKSGVRKHRGFESRPLRHPPHGERPMRSLPAPVLAYALCSARAPVLSGAFASDVHRAAGFTRFGGAFALDALDAGAVPAQPQVTCPHRAPSAALGHMPAPPAYRGGGCRVLVSAAAGVGPSFAGRVLPGRFAVSGRGRLVDYGAALEMRFGATRRGFESRPLRHRLARGLAHGRVDVVRFGHDPNAWTV